MQTTTLDHPMLSTTAMSTMMMQPTGQKGMSPMQACPTVVGGMVDHSQIMGQHQTSPPLAHNHTDNCPECQFEREKRLVTQRAFERAMNISKFLMEEVEKLSYHKP
jgi:hypothetical protein